MTKEQLLIDLRSKIIDRIYKERWEEIWFFPKYKGVMGYLGTQDIIFLSINPSTGSFPSKVDKRYYKYLKKFGFTNAHLTDVFKQRAKNWRYLESNKDLRNEAINFLKEEIDIISPKLIVLVGKGYEKFYNLILQNSSIENITISHWAFRYGTEKRLRSRMRKEFHRVKEKYMSINNGF